MQISQVPARFGTVWAQNASPQYVRAIPEASQQGIVPGAASLTDGFPPLNFQDPKAGGVPPFGQDENGILKWITQRLQWADAGGPAVFDPTFVSKVGGYPRGALLASLSVAGVVWLNTADGNTTNPDGGSPAGWQPLLSGAAAPATSLVHYGPDTSSTANQIIIPAVSPDFTTLQNGLVFEIRPAVAVTGPTMVTLKNLSSVPLVRYSGAAFQAGDAPAARPFLATYFDGQLNCLAPTPKEIVTIVLPFTPAGSASASAFTPGNIGPVANGSSGGGYSGPYTVAQSLTIPAGASYAIINAVAAFRSIVTSQGQDARTRIRYTVQGGFPTIFPTQSTAKYQGIRTAGGNQIPCPISITLQGMDPTKSTFVELLCDCAAGVVDPNESVAIYDPRIDVSYGG